MNATGESISESLRQVEAERAARLADSVLAEQVAAVKAFQHARFARTYADLLGDPRFEGAARFFLEDLYGPSDFTDRDAQFARIVPALVRLFPQEVAATVADLGALHALSERFDTAMAAAAAGHRVLDADRYAEAWTAVGRPAERERQIALMVSVGHALDRYTRSPLLRQSLRIMRRPARAAGLGTLQQFLERGFDTFRAMRGAHVFLDLVARRERALAAALFAGARGSEVLG